MATQAEKCPHAPSFCTFSYKCGRSTHTEDVTAGNSHRRGYDSSEVVLALLLTPRCRVLLEQLTGLQLVKKFLIFHGTRMFITAHTSVRHISLPNPVHIPISHLLKTHPNIIHTSTPRSPQCSLSLRFPH